MENQIAKVQVLPTIFATLPDDSAELSMSLANLSVLKLEKQKEEKDAIEKELKELGNRTWYAAIHQEDAKMRKAYLNLIHERTEELVKEYHAIPVQRTIRHRLRAGDESIKQELLKLVAWVVEHYNSNQTLSTAQAKLLVGDMFAMHGDLRLEDIAICFRDNLGTSVFNVDPAMFIKWLGEYKTKLGEFRLKRYSNQLKAQKFVGTRSSVTFNKAIRGENTAK